MAEFNASQLGLKRLPKEVEQAVTATGGIGTQNPQSNNTPQQSFTSGPSLSQDEALLKQKIEQAGGGDEQFYQALRQYRNEKGIAVGQRDTSGNIITRLGETIKIDSNEDDGLFESIGKFGVNIFGDSVQLVGELVDIVSHPIQFAKNTYDLGYGVSDALLNKVGLDLPGEDRAEMARLIGNQIKENFTDIDKFKKMIVENPVDTILTLVPGVNAAKGAATASKLTKTAKALEIIEKTMMAPIRAELSLAKGLVKTPGQIGSKVFEFGMSQGTGMNVDTLKTLMKNPKIIDDVKGGIVSRDSLAGELFKGIEKLETEMLSSLGEYKSTRSFPASVKLGSTVNDFLTDAGVTINNTGKIVDDSFKFTKSELGKLQELVDKVQTVAGSKQGYIGIDDFLDLRQYVNKSLAKFDTGMDSDKLKNLGKALYKKLNKDFRDKIPGLEELDQKFMNQIDFLNTIKKDYFMKSGKPKDNFMSLLETITNKGKEVKLDRLREIIPDIEGKSNSLKAVADIDAAMGSKVGTYTRGGLFVGGLFTGNPILAISQLILLNPAIAAKVLQGVGYSREFINRIIDKVKNGKKLEKEEIVAVKEASQSVMADDVKKIGSDGPEGDDINAFVKEFETEIDNLAGNKEGLAEAKEAILDYDIPQENKAYLLEKVNQHLDDIDGYEFEMTLGMGGYDTLREVFGDDLTSAFNTLEGIKKRTKTTKGGDKMTSIEFQKTPAYKKFSERAQSYLKQNDPDGTMSVQELYEKMDDINFSESQRSTKTPPDARSIDSDLKSIDPKNGEGFDAAGNSLGIVDTRYTTKTGEEKIFTSIKEFLEDSDVADSYKPNVGSAKIINKDVDTTIDTWAKNAGVKRNKLDLVQNLDENNSKKIADDFDAMEHNPQDPKVLKAYNALKTEIKGQYEALEKAGYKFEPYKGEGEPYKNSKEMMEDLMKNKHLYYFKTEGNFGQNDIFDNPLLEKSGIIIDGEDVVFNDIFRAVHDAIGHGTHGPGFGPVGEENAWRTHSMLLSDDARRALTTETRGQNSWVNYGKQLRREDGTIPKKGDADFVPLSERNFADQKIGLLNDSYVFPERNGDIDVPKLSEYSKTPEDTNIPDEEFIPRKNRFLNRNTAMLGVVGATGVNETGE